MKTLTMTEWCEQNKENKANKSHMSFATQIADIDSNALVAPLFYIEKEFEKIEQDGTIHEIHWDMKTKYFVRSKPTDEFVTSDLIDLAYHYLPHTKDILISPAQRKIELTLDAKTLGLIK